MKRVTRAGSPLFSYLSALCLLCALAVPLRAAEPRPATFSIYGLAVGGEPGEDPHLRIKDPAIITEPVGIDGYPRSPLATGDRSGDLPVDTRPRAAVRRLPPRFWLFLLGGVRAPVR